jgi:hypothetical protein
VRFTEEYSNCGYSGKRCTESDWNETRDLFSKKKDSSRPPFFTDRFSTTTEKVSPDLFLTDFTVMLWTVMEMESKVESCFWMTGWLSESFVAAMGVSNTFVPGGERVPDGEIPPEGDEIHPARMRKRIRDVSRKIVLERDR